MDTEPLRNWFLKHRRDLPWRNETSPYAVWVSEVMLQQTQVTVVIPYFLRWMKRFPTIKSLATSPLDEVIKLWEGLGYYSRVRNLHSGAKQILEHFKGELPTTASELKQIKGIGPYTLGAILSFAFHKKVAAVDGNVIRVLSRYYAIHDDICKPSTITHIQEKAQNLLPDQEPWIITEALIELGATVCQRKAHCSICPLKSSCQAYQHGLAATLPVKSKKQKTIHLRRCVAVIHHDHRYLIRRGQEGQIMSDLHEFPYFETTSEGVIPSAFEDQVQVALNLKVTFQGFLPEVTHSFTKYRVRLIPAYFSCDDVHEPTGMEWKTKEELDQLAFSSGHRKLYQSL